MFFLSTTGHLECMKKFEDTLSCFSSFPSPGDGGLITLACTHSKQLLVFEGTLLKWAAKLDEIPVMIATGEFG